MGGMRNFPWLAGVAALIFGHFPSHIFNSLVLADSNKLLSQK